MAKPIEWDEAMENYKVTGAAVEKAQEDCAKSAENLDKAAEKRSDAEMILEGLDDPRLLVDDDHELFNAEREAYKEKDTK